MGCVLPKGSKPSFASASLPKQLHLQLTNMETAAKRASETATEKLGKCLKVKGTNGEKTETPGWPPAFPWAPPMSLVAPREPEHVYVTAGASN